MRAYSKLWRVATTLKLTSSCRADIAAAAAKRIRPVARSVFEPECTECRLEDLRLIRAAVGTSLACRSWTFLEVALAYLDLNDWPAIDECGRIESGHSQLKLSSP